MRQPETEHYELYDGEVLAMAPERSAHALTMFHIARRLAEAEQGPPSPKLAPGLVVESVHLMGTWGNQTEPGCLEAADKGVNVGNRELDLDFTVRRHTDKYREKVTLVVGLNTRKNAPSGLLKGTFGNFFQKRRFV